jgi:transcriptional regulator with XRE-family HTH domain
MSARRTTLVAARNARGLSQQELADLTGIGRVSIARWEAGMHEPSLTAALTLAGALGLPVERLFAAEARSARKRAA